jgi:hypothetical protein
MADTTTEIVESVGEIVPYEPPATALTMFGTSDPAVALGRITAIAGLFVDVVRDRGLVEKIRGKEYVTASGYSVLAGLTGLSPFVVWTRELEDGYIVRVEVRRVADGTAIAAAEQICSRSELKWAKADKHALLGMATTRAQRRALAGPLTPIVELAGYAPGYLEELPADAVVVESDPDRGKIPPESRPSRDQAARIGELLAILQERDPAVDWKEEARNLAGCPGDQLTGTIADMLIGWLEQELSERA